MKSIFLFIEIYQNSFQENAEGRAVWDDDTFYLYISIIILISAFGLFAEKTRGSIQSLWVVAAATVLSFILGFRGELVGADTIGYVESFNRALETDAWADSTSEPGYHLLVMLLRAILPNSTAFLTFISTLTVFFVFNTLWKYREHTNLLIAFSFYVGLYYFQALNLLRIYLAAAFVLWNYHYLIEKKYRKFFLIVVLTSMLHYSTVVMLLPLAYLWLHQKSPLLALGFIACLMIVSIPLISQFANYIAIARYAEYGESNESSGKVGVMLFFEYLPCFFMVWYALRHKIKGQWRDILISLTVTGFFIRTIAYFITIAGRLGIHFMGLYILIIPYFVNHLKVHHKTAYILLMPFFVGYLLIRMHFYFIGYLAVDQIMPYAFFWDE